MNRTILIPALAVGCLTTALAQPVDEAVENAVIAAWQQHDKALSEHDIDGVLAVWADGEDSVLLGTGPGERWVGKEEIREAYENFFEDFDPYTMQSVCGWYVLGAQGDIAWGVTECDFTDSLDGDAREFPINFSVVLVNQDESWKFRTLHFSTLTAGESR